MKLTIGTISWNNLQFTKDFVSSLYNIFYDFDLLIWDNGSNDGTLEWLKNLQLDIPHCKEFKYFHSDSNLGMVEPWNVFLSWFEQDKNSTYCLLCNNDIRFTSTINNIFPFMQENDHCGLVCPAMLPRETDLSQLESIAIEQTKLPKLLIGYDELNGPCMIIPKHAFKAVGFMDSQFQLSFEDCDYYERVKKAGMSCCVYYGSAVWHYGGASTSKNHIPIEKNIYYQRFQRKHG